MGEPGAGDEHDRDRNDRDQREDARAEDARPASEGLDALPPDLLEAIRQIGATGRASLGATGDAARAMRTLVAADISLARSALGRTLALSGFAIAFGGSAWLLLMATLVVFLSRQLGLPWSAALLIPALLSVATTVLAGWLAVRYFEHTRLQATRRQLARIGIGELADFVPDADSSGSSRDATTRHEHGRPLKDHDGVDVTSP